MEYFTTNRPIFLVPSTDCCEEFEKIDKFLLILEKSGVWKIIKKVKLEKCKSNKGRKGYDIYKLFAAIIYCFAKFSASLRDIEDKCIFDIRIIYIMEGKIPDYSIIGDFINNYIVPNQYEIFTTITKQIITEFNLTIEDAYIDGSKFEANANKYKFVWKPTTHHKKLDVKIKQYLLELNYTTIGNKKDLIKTYELNEIIKDYISKNNIDINNIPNGRGKRLTNEQKKYKLGYQYLLKLLEYEEKESICGENRNSYFKTDKDATAMMLKEDYYSKLSHDFHAAYNIQVLVSNLLIVMYGVYQDRTDYHTFKKIFDNYYKYYQSYPPNAVGDSGYGIYVNYDYLRAHHIGNYLKYQQWNGESSGKNPQLFYTYEDGVICLNTNIAEEIPFISNRHQRYKNSKLYKFNGCNNCGYTYKCKKNMKNKNEDFRIVELIPDYEKLKEQARNNLLSPKGIELRINRSIQVEGTFGQIKSNMNYERIRRRGIESVSCEIMLMCLGVNIRRLVDSFDETKFKNTCWQKPQNLKKEVFPIVKQKKELIGKLIT